MKTLILSVILVGVAANAETKLKCRFDADTEVHYLSMTVDSADSLSSYVDLIYDRAREIPNNFKRYGTINSVSFGNVKGFQVADSYELFLPSNFLEHHFFSGSVTNNKGLSYILNCTKTF